jgi:hypothetical protein
MRPLDLRPIALLTVCVALVLGLVACGGGETTVTVTETVAAKPEEGGGDGKSNPETGGKGGAVAGYVDNVATDSESMILSGWAASADLTEPATQVTASVGGQQLAGVVPTLQRKDVVEVLGKPGLEESGFELRLPLSALECGAPAAGIEVFASLDGKEGAILFGEGIKGRIAAEC